MKTDLKTIPGVGAQIERDLIALGYDSVASLAGEDPEQIYERDCIRRGCRVDRCMLYVYRCAVYYADHAEHEPEKLRWWYWKDNLTCFAGRFACS